MAVADVRLAGTPDGLTGDFVAVTVGDTGIGMPPEILARARQPYFSTKPDGTGLGLSQVDSFAVEFGGGVAMASEVGRGTTITILLPRAAAKKRQTIDGWTVARGRAESEAGLPWAVAACRRDRSRKSRGGRAPVWQVTIADHVLPNSRSPSGGVRRGT